MCNVNISSGEVSQFTVDFFLPGIIPFRFIRTYSSREIKDGPLGFGWKFNVEIYVILSEGNLNYYNGEGKTIELKLPGIGEETFDEQSGLRLKRTETEILLIEADLNSLVFPLSNKYNGRYLLGFKKDPYGNLIRYYYDEKGRISKIVDTMGRFIIFSYNVKNRLSNIRVEFRNDRKNLVTFEYDNFGDLISVTDRTAYPYFYSYQNHLLVQVTNRIGGSLYYQYDNKNRCIRTWRDEGVLFREIKYDDALNNISVMDSRGFITIYKNNDKGLTEEEIDPTGHVKSDLFDNKGNLIMNSSSSGAIEEITTYDSDKGLFTVSSIMGKIEFKLNDMGKPISVTNPEGHTTIYEYDHGGSLIKKLSPLDAEWQFEYDSCGFLICATDPKGYRVRKRRTKDFVTILEDDLGVISKTWFDIFGNAIAYEDAAGNKTLMEHDAAGKLKKIIYPDLSEVKFIYNKDGNLKSARDETGLITHYNYNLNNSLIELNEPGNRKLKFEYDTEENLVSLINFKGEKAEFVFDCLNRITKVVYFDKRFEFFEYDDRDNVIRVLNGSGEIIVEMEYDEASRLVKEKFSDGNQVAISYGSQNQVLSIENSDIFLQYEWNAEMKIVKEHIGDVIIEFEYDLCGNRTCLTSSTGRHIAYEWDQRRRLKRIIDSKKYIYDFNYNLIDLIESYQLPNGLVQEFKFDKVNRLKRRRTIESDTGKEVTSRSFFYDDANRLVKTYDKSRGMAEYQYDERERLLAVRKKQENVEQYQYDENGNLTRKGKNYNLSIGTGDRILKTANAHYEYDSDGNRIFKKIGSSETQYQYNKEGRLTKTLFNNGKSIQFYYDPFGRRISKIFDTHQTDFVWDGNTLLDEINGNETIQYLFMPGSYFPLGKTIKDKHYSYSFDQLGTVTEIFNDRKEIVWAAEFSSFGKIKEEPIFRIKNPLRFLGQYSDEEFDLYYNRYRYYDPEVGNYTSPDPIGFNGGLNFYNYVPNPINWVDPLGLVVCEITPKCSWSEKQYKDSQKKMSAMNDKLGRGGKRFPDEIPEECKNRKTAKDIYNDCREENPDMPPLKETSSKCSNEQADHILEVCFGGGEEDCDNLMPLNESVNKSFGPQVASCVKANLGTGKRLTKIDVLPMTKCRKGGRKCPDV